MSLVINTNAAATAASNNLASSNQALQRSLNRLSSGSKIVSPADDAGGLAVSMKLAAAAKRQGAAITNVANSTSYLQTQDGALKVVGQILDRVSELKTLSTDPTKSSSDIANYDVEFQALQEQLTSIADETFNGVNLFGSSTFNVATSEDGVSSVTVGGADLMGGNATTLYSDNFSDLSGWSSVQSGSVAGNALILGDDATVTRTQALTGAFEVTFDFQFSSATNTEIGLQVNGSNQAANFMASVGDTAVHSARISFDGAGNTTWYLDSVDIGAIPSLPTSITDLSLRNTFTSGNTITVTNFEITTAGGAATAVGDVTSASSIQSLNLSTVTTAIQELATHRADNGAQQSRLGFASELLTTNKANLEAANSRIVDVDVATESTLLARQNILVQSGTAMLAQANQSTQGILRLLG